MDEYRYIPDYPDSIEATTALMRFLDGLAFRFRWATDGLRQEDYDFRPSSDCMSIKELVRHVWGLVNWVCISLDSQRYPRPAEIELIRRDILRLIVGLNEKLSTMDDAELGTYTIEGNPFWNMINGPICDALTHVGQINSFRRLSGNPTPDANVFLGRPPEDPNP